MFIRGRETSTEKGAVMSRYFGKSIIKYILPTTLSLSLLATATSCDNIFTSTEDPTENTGYVQVTDEAGNPVTNALGEFVTIPVEAESEWETEFYEAMDWEELKIDYLQDFHMQRALSGDYTLYFEKFAYGMWQARLRSLDLRCCPPDITVRAKRI